MAGPLPIDGHVDLMRAIEGIEHFAQRVRSAVFRSSAASRPPEEVLIPLEDFDPVSDTIGGHPSGGPPVPQRFASGSKASRLPWHLPEQNASSPGVAADQASIGDLVLRAASVVGPGHRCIPQAKPRQDAYRVARDAAGRHLIIAVADGMGDSSRSEFGASVAVSTAVNLVRRELDAGINMNDLSTLGIFRDVANAMLGEANNRGLFHDEIRTTLAVAVLATEVSAKGWLSGWVAQIGDTHAWLRTPDGWMCHTGGPKDTFNGSELAEYLPHTPEAVRTFDVQMTAGMAFGLMTDGIGDAFTQVDGASAWLNDRWGSPPSLAAFIIDVDYDARGQLDDRTAVVVWVEGGNAGPVGS
jgi:hypothetical protein